MTENTNPPGMNSHQPLHGIGKSQADLGGKPSSKVDPESGVAFRALIEKLQTQALELSRESESVAGPEELAGAMDKAGESLRNALSLSDQLLEAYRMSLHRETPNLDASADGGGGPSGDNT